MRPSRGSIRRARESLRKSTKPGQGGDSSLKAWLESYRWAYTGVQGALTFCQDKVKGGLWFRVVDLIVSDFPRLRIKV